MSQYYPTHHPNGSFQYSGTNQGLPQGFPQQYVIMPNVPTGGAGAQPGYPVQQQFRVGPYVAGSARGVTDQAASGMHYGQNVVLTQSYPAQAGAGQQSAAFQQLYMPVQQPLVNPSNVQYVGNQAWSGGSQFSNGPQQGTQSSVSYSQQPQNMYKKQEQRSSMYQGLYNSTVPQPVNQPVVQQQAPQPPQQRKRTAITIVDPNTGQEVDLAKSSATHSASAASDSAAAPPANNVAADFAARVAATLTTPSESTAKTTSSSTTAADATQSVARSGDENHEVQLTQTNSISSDAKLESETVSHREADSKPIVVEQVECRPPDNVQTIPPLLPATNNQESSQQSNIAAGSLLSSEKTTEISAVTLESNAQPSIESEEQVDGAIRSTSVLDHPCSHVPLEGTTPVSDSSAEATDRSTSDLSKTDQASGKDAKKKKNKRKDLNNKGLGSQQGSDMDAYIDEAPQKQMEITEEASSTPALEASVGVTEVEGNEPAVIAENEISSSSLSKTEMTPPSVDSSIETKVVEEATQLTPIAQNETVSDSKVAKVSDTEVTSVVSTRPETEQPLISNANMDDGQPLSEVDGKLDDVSNVEADVATKDDASKIELKYKYSEDQWSPLNPEGKKQYDREFMMQLQFADLSRQKPSNLPVNLDIVLNEPASLRPDLGKNRSIELGRIGLSMAPDFTPGYVKSSPSGSKRPVSRNSMKKDMGMGGSGPQGGRKVISVTLQQDIQLNKAENAWKPQLMTKKELSADEDLATQALYKKIRGILNKLTPQKFATLMEQVTALPIDSEERLKGCIDIIFEKAISEPNFSVAYANMAKRMLVFTVTKEQDPSQTVTFRTLLLNKCQQEFEKDKLEEIDLAERQKKIEEAETEEKRKQLIEEQEEAASKSKRRSLGNIRFIGELYKLRMLTEMIMHECLMKLLRSNDEDSLECLCQLLTTIGQELDNKQSKLQPRMEAYFKQLDTLVADRNKVSSRIRFMLLDTIDLRKNNWVPRRAKNNPKTIEQIHKEAQEEELKKQAEMQKAAMERSRRGGGAGGGGGRGGPPQAGGVGEDGWNTVSRPPKNILDPQRLKLTKREQVDDNIQLGPGGRGMNVWQMGSRVGKGSAAAAAAPEERQQQGNRYSLLNSSANFDPPMDSRNRGPGGRGAATAGGPGFRHKEYQGSISGPPGRPAVSRPSFDRNVEGTLRQDRREFASPASSRSASREPRPVDTSLPVDRTASAASAAPGNAVKATERELSAEELERKTKSLMEEYLHLDDLKEATECVKELASPKSLHLFVYQALMLNLERSAQARQRTGALLHHLVKNRILSNSQYIEGLRTVLEQAEDMMIDIPRIWQYFGELIGPMVEEGGLPLNSLRNAFQPLLDCSGGDKAGVVMSVVLHDAVHRLGHQRVAEFWQHSGLEWSEFVHRDQVESFLKDQELDFTLAKTDSHSKPVTSERLQEELHQLYEDADVPNERILDFLKDKVEEVDAKCIRALTTAICSTALIVSGGDSEEKKTVFNVPLIKNRLPVLVKVINGRQDLEIEVLFAIQVIVHKKDVYTGAISELFDTIYDEEVVSDATFFRWRDDRLTGEQIGRGVVINTLNQFFKWLEEDATPN